MVAITHVLLLAAAASAAVIQGRTPATVLSNLKKINTASTTLDKAVTSWDGSVSGVIPIQNDSNALDNDVKSATKEAGTEKQATSAASKQIIGYVTNTLAPNTKKTLNDLVAAKPKFKADGLDSTVESNLKTLKTDVDALGQALLKIASADQKANAQKNIKNIDGYFAIAIKAFST